MESGGCDQPHVNKKQEGKLLLLPTATGEEVNQVVGG